jgi:predicted ATPase/DNA-binding winged helix-turn-helix (wHTH) protein
VVASPGNRASLKQFGGFALDTANQCLWRDGAQIALQPKPFAVLHYLVENPGRLITHDELLDKLWPETFVQPQVLRTYMLELRKILGDDAGQPRFIQTLPKRGYCFVASVTEGAAPNGTTTQTPSEIHLEVSALVGRREELSSLGGEFKRVLAGERRVVFLSGESGIGKTALTDVFSRNAAESLSIARGQCVPGFEKEDFYPVMEALAQLCASANGEAACKVFSRLAPEWLVPLGRLDAPVSERMPGNLCAALEEIAASQPLLLILEDLQWADAATLHLISALARRRAPARLLILGTHRARSVSTELKQLRQDLLLRRACVDLILAPLGKSAVTELLGRELKQEAPPAGLGAFVYEHSEGNPLFAITLLNHLIAQGQLKRRGDEWQITVNFDEQGAGLPDELAQMVELEIERLGPEDQRLLEAGSVMNVAFPAWAVAAAIEQPAGEVEEACDRLARDLHFLLRAGEDELPGGSQSAFYAFSHCVYREVLWKRQGAARRARCHIRIAERLGELFAGREAHVAREMAMHYEAAGSWKQGAGALRAAAHYAAERNAKAEAVELLERALRIAENHPEAQAETRAVREDLHAFTNPKAGPAKRQKSRPESLTFS